MIRNKDKGFTDIDLLLVFCYLLLVKKLTTNNNGLEPIALTTEKKQISQKINENLVFSLQRGIGSYLLPSQGDFSSVTLSFLTTLLAITGFFGVAQAEELPEQLVGEIGNRGGTEQGSYLRNSSNSQEVVTESATESGKISDNNSVTNEPLLP
ncbi:hypothetical protein, partial [Limnofasciculus baicalensis]